MSNQVISIMGCGWLGFPLAEKLVETGWTVKGSTTTKDKIQLMEQAGIIPFYITADPEPAGDRVDNFFQADILFWNIPPGVRGGEKDKVDFRNQTKSILEHVKKAGIKHVIFVSSTSVYPDKAQIMTEEDAGPASSLSGEALLEAESLLLSQKEFNTIILRLGGLFGAGRHPAYYLSGRKNVSKPEAPVNMVHLDDVIAACEKVLEALPEHQVYNIVSDNHPTRREFYTEACKELNLEAPEFDNSKETGKKISNEKIKKELFFRFQNR